MKQIVLGLDPGSRNTGFGLVERHEDRIRYLDCGVIRLPEKAPLAERLLELQGRLEELFKKCTPAVTVIEKIFLGKNVDSAFILGHARGICLLVSAQHRVDVREYAARYVKKCITGSGSASKELVQMLVFRQLNLLNTPALAYDASDALSLALTHARLSEVEDRRKRLEETTP